MTSEEKRRLKKRTQNLSELIADLESGNIFPEDLDDELLLKLKSLLAKRG